MKKRVWGTVLAASACASYVGAAVCECQATEKINSVSIKFEIEGYDENGYPEIEAYTSSSKYSVDGISEADTDFDDSSGSESAADKKYVVELSAKDGYAFYLTKKSQVNLSGIGAEYVKASRLNSGTTLEVTIKFTNLEDICSPVENASWKDDGIATWDASANAMKYRLVLKKNSGNSKIFYTGGTRYDFRPLMTSPGSYTFSVRPVSKSEYMAEGTESGSFSVSKEAADAYRENYGVEFDYVQKEDGTLDDGPDAFQKVYKNTGWKQEESGWWYQNNDGSYPQSDWICDGGEWYFFDENGMMVADKAIKWGGNRYYLGEDGRMLKNCTVPDGRTAGADGILTGKMSDEAVASGLYDEEDENDVYGPGPGTFTPRSSDDDDEEEEEEEGKWDDADAAHGPGVESTEESTEGAAAEASENSAETAEESGETDGGAGSESTDAA